MKASTAFSTRFYFLVKRIFDVVMGGALALATLPLQAAITIASLFFFRGRPFFIQLRPGKDERPIYVVKFRTMRDAYNHKGELLPDACRLTRYGRFLRRTSFDELPQLWLVVAGKMSLVGPRPLLTEYLPFYNERQRLRHRVKPGLTGWAQVSGRNDLDWLTRLELDAQYAENPGFGWDLKILWRTLEVALTGRGVWRDGGVPKFTESLEKNKSGGL